MYIKISLFLLGFAFFIPNISRPWNSFWQESVAFTGLLLGYIFFSKSKKSNKDILFISLSIFLFLIIDCIFRNDIYIGDYVIGVVYIWVFVASIIYGLNVKKEYFFYLLIFSSVFSSGIAIAQWLEIDLNRLYFVEHSLGTRAYANLGQANHFSALVAFGVFSCILLRIKKEISLSVFLIVIAFLSFSAAISQSRTFGFSIFFVALLVYVVGYFKNIKIKKYIILSILFLYVVSYLILPIISDFLLIGLERRIGSASVNVDSGRFVYWSAIYEAILQRPFLGYGWMRSAEAQLVGTSTHSSTAIFQYAHNIFIDFAIWFGVPAAIFLVVLFFIFFRQYF